MNLIIDNYEITEPIINIINLLKSESGDILFRTIINKGDYLSVTCPFHKNGAETHPSCSIYTNTVSSDVAPGTFHCFTCGKKGQLYNLVAFVLHLSVEEAKLWLIERFGSEIGVDEEISYDLMLVKEDNDEDIINPKNTYLDESILQNYAYYHPYTQYRKISFDIAKQFQIGWNQARNTITFPVWDEYNHLVMITERSIDSKKFYIPEGVDKPVYLLNFAIKNHVNTVIVCEGQIDALVAYSYGFPAVALFGSGTTDYQLDILKKSGIMNYILMYDNDLAGRKGAERFKAKMGKCSLIRDIVMPIDKDIADLTKVEFVNLLQSYDIHLT